MKRRLLALVVVVGAMSLTACQEDPAMDELVQDIELQSTLDPDDKTDPPGGGSGSGGSGSNDS